MNNLQAAISADEEKLTETLQRAKAELLVMQRHSLNERRTEELSKRLEPETERWFVPGWLDKPRDLKVSKTNNMGIFLSFIFLRQKKNRSLLKIDLRMPSPTKLCCRRKRG